MNAAADGLFVDDKRSRSTHWRASKKSTGSEKTQMAWMFSSQQPEASPASLALVSSRRMKGLRVG